MFSYLDGFDNICAKVTPMEVVTLVNKMFLTFDILSEKHDVYKVKGFLIQSNDMNGEGIPYVTDVHVPYYLSQYKDGDGRYAAACLIFAEIYA